MGHLQLPRSGITTYEEGILKQRLGQAYRNGKLDVSRESQRVDDRKSSTYAFLLRVIEEFADVIASQDTSLDKVSGSATWAFGAFAMHWRYPLELRQGRP